MSELTDALREMADDGNRTRTHSESCWQWHLSCAAMYAADLLDNDFTDDEREEIRKRLGAATTDLIAVVRKALESIRTYEAALGDAYRRLGIIHPECAKCGHPHGPPFDFCRYPKDEYEAVGAADTYGYEACGCHG